jgi:hypothetical protein
MGRLGLMGRGRSAGAGRADPGDRPCRLIVHTRFKIHSLGAFAVVFAETGTGQWIMLSPEARPGEW